MNPKAPGVYVYEVPSGARPIGAEATSTTAFIGYGDEGPVKEAFPINKWDDYLSKFGNISSKDDSLGLAVWAYFLNGGKKAIIYRLAGDDVLCARLLEPLKNINDHNVMMIEAKSVGESGNKIKIEVEKENEMEFTIKVYKEQADGTDNLIDTLSKLNFNEKSSSHFLKVLEDNMHIKASLVDKALEDDFFNKGESKSDELPVNFDKLGIMPKDDLILSVDGNTNITIKLDELSSGESYTIDKIVTQIQGKVSNISDRDKCYKDFKVEVSEDKFITLVSGSGRKSYSSVEVKGGKLKGKLGLGNNETYGSQDLIPVTKERIKLEGGKYSKINTKHYEDALNELRKYPEVNIIVLPGRYLNEKYKGAIDLAVSHCNEMKNRMLIIDPEKSKSLKTKLEVTDMIKINSEFTVLYYPWIEMMNPLFDSEKDNPEDRTVLIPPSAFAAGIWSKIDYKRGVWKAPAGVETNLLGVARLEHYVEEAHQEILNDLGVNCIRALPGYGSVIWGSRTLATNSATEWRYIPIRRTAIMLKESIKNNIQWAVFEPNDEPLWATLRTNIGAFMNSLFRAGAFQGKKASDAYFVRCGLNDTMEQVDIDMGKVIIKVGFAPLKPAEFVIVTIEQKVNSV